MKYFFRIHLNSNNIIDCIPKGYEEKTLIDYDKFTTKDDYKRFLEKATTMIEKTIHDIKYVTIGATKNNNKTEIYEYSLINNNPYMENIFDYIEPKEVDMFGTNKYKSRRTVISNTSPNYEEMKDYIFDRIKDKTKTKTKELLNDVLKNDSSFKEALDQYSKVYYDSYSNEDQKERTRLETCIKDELTDYKTYRKLSVARYSFEQNFLKKEEEAKKLRQELVKKQNDQMKMDLIYKALDEKYEESKSFENQLNKYMKENEDDFIPETEEELNMMNDNSSGKVL